MRNSPRRPTVDSVDNALRLLLLFCDSNTLRVSDVADHLNVARSTAHRLLMTMVNRGFAVQDSPSRVYRPGPRLLEVGMAALGSLDIRGRARPFLEQLAADTGETPSLLIQERGNVRFVDSIESTSSIRVASRFGLLLPAHATSGGKAMLACLSPAEVDELYAGKSFERVTASTIRSRKQLDAELAEIREKGYAFNTQESEIGLGAAGMAVRDSSGRPVAAVTVAGPVQRMEGPHLAGIVSALQRAVNGISGALYG
jgi:IclR family acetate operon transcriptional repressor